MNFEDVYCTVQTDLVARLQAMPFFKNIMIAAPRVWKEGEKLHTPKTITERVDQALIGLLPTGGGIGAAVRVFQPTVNVDKPNGRKAKLMMVARTEVHPIINNTGRLTSRIAFEVMRAGMGFSPMVGFCTLYCDGQSFLPYVSDDRKFETVDVLFQSDFTISPVDQPTTPAIAVGANGTVTLTSPEQADIWYTLDPKIFPSPQAPGAKLYAAPFQLPLNAQIRWAAYIDGLEAGSSAGFQTITF